MPGKAILTSQAGGAVDREPAGEVLFEVEVGADDGLDLEFGGVVATVGAGGNERVPGAALVEIDKAYRLGAVAEGDQRAQQRRAEARVDERRVDRMQVGDQGLQVVRCRLPDQPGEAVRVRRAGELAVVEREELVDLVPQGGEAAAFGCLEADRAAA